MKRKLILFDWGNIVESLTTGYSCRNAWNDLFHACGYNGNKDITRELSRYKLSAISSIKEFEKTYEQMAIEFKFNVNFNKFSKLYKEIFAKIDYYKDVADYEVSLKKHCYIGILSNLTMFDKERLNNQVDLSKYDYVFLSFEMGVRKPDKKIYEKVEENIPFSKKDILFIDDKEENIKAAKEFGWQVLLTSGLELNKIKKACEKFINEK